MNHQVSARPLYSPNSNHNKPPDYSNVINLNPVPNDNLSKENNNVLHRPGTSQGPHLSRQQQFDFNDI